MKMVIGGKQLHCLYIRYRVINRTIYKTIKLCKLLSININWRIHDSDDSQFFSFIHRLFYYINYFIFFWPPIDS